MHLKPIISAAAACLIAASAIAGTHYVGGDISLLPEYENAKAKYMDASGKSISNLLTYCYDQNMNAMRIRLFVNPKDFPNNDPNVCQDLDYITPLCLRIKQAGFKLMLDFHYSDTWADPAKQWTPLAWQNLTDEQLYDKIYDYTKNSLLTLKEYGVVPDFIQTGNEISYGMLWGASTASASSLKKVLSGSDANWPRFTTLLKNAIKACREVCPDAKIVIHTERVANQAVQRNFYTQMDRYNVEYDIIGLSYYPYFHGNINVLNSALTALEKDFPGKEIMIVETGYPYAWEVPGTTQKVDYAYSDAGQNQFAQALLDCVAKHEAVDGIFWWWMEYNAFGTSLSGWYNAPLFDSRTGRATKALATIATYNDVQNNGIGDIEADSEQPDDLMWYDLTGRPIAEPTAPGFYIHGRKAVFIR